MVLECELDVTVDDGALRLAFTVTNGGSDPVELQFADGCKADFAVHDGERERWRYSDGRAFPQVLSRERLEPGEGTTFVAEWTDPVPGEYAAIAELRARDRRCEARTDVAV